MTRRSYILGLAAVVGCLASEPPAHAEDILQWIAHYDPTTPQGRVNLNPLNRPPLNNGSDLPDVRPPQPPPLPTEIPLVFQRRFPDGTFQWWLDGGNGVWYVKVGNFNNAPNDALIQVARTPMFVMLRHKPTNEHIVMYHDGKMWSTSNAPPGQSWRLFAQAQIFRLNR
jgi:hypothetical protein